MRLRQLIESTRNKINAFRLTRPVRSVMSSPVISGSPDTTLQDIARLMWDHDIGFVPIVAKGKAVGVVTDRDIAMAALHQHKALHEMYARDFVGKRLLCSCSPTDNILSCMKQMEEYEVRRALVVGPEGKLEGVVSLGDILNCTWSATVRIKGLKIEVYNKKLINLLKSVSGRRLSSI